MRKTIILLLLATASVTLQAQAPSGYYNNANGKTGEELLQALHDIIDNHDPVSYDNIWNAFYSLDPRTDDNTKVWDIYSDIPNGTPKYLFSFGDNQCGNYTQEGDCYNREHSWPQSWFNSQGTPSSDLHHIFPTDGYVNAQRGNNPYGEVQNTSWISKNGSKLGTCKTSLGYNGTVFEPIDEYKGDIARTYFYMSVRYHGEDDNWSTSGMTEKSVIKPWAIAMLLQWNEEDPVSQKEISRNNKIYNNYQHNRNPFIDNPTYARMIWDPNWIPNSNSGNGDYVKITSPDKLTDGDYLIVYEEGSKAFDGSLANLDASGNNINVSIANGVIPSNDTTNAIAFTITQSGSAYTILSASGCFIGQTTDANGLVSSTTETYSNNITFTTDGNVNIISSGGAYLRYNSNASQERFRYFKSSTYANQKPIHLYKKTEPDIPFEQKYHLVTSNDQLLPERTYLIVNIAAAKAMSKTQNTNNRGATDVAITDDNTITIPGEACELTLGINNNKWTLYDPTNNGYLYAASSSSNYLRTKSALDDNGRWTIDINPTSHAATIKAQGSNSRNIIRYNSSSNPPVFSCYSSNQQDVFLFVRSENYDITENTTIQALLSCDHCTIRSNATLTITGTAASDDANSFLIEEGGQLIHHNDGVKATLKKSITSYTTTTNGWYTIAAPFTDFSPTQAATGNYDLYAYDEDEPLEWINYKANQSNFTTSSTTGYLYAHAPSTTLQINGTLNSGNFSEEISLSYANSDVNIRGFNLLGNPTAHEITFNKGAGVSDGYYFLKNSGIWEYEPGNTVPVGRGFLVKANGEGQTVTLNPQTRACLETQSNAYLQIDVDGEKAYVKMTEGIDMPLLNFRGHSSCVYLSREGQPYIMLANGNGNDIELCYQARQHGQHHLSFDAKDVELPYLHLVDRLTGSEVDLLQTPRYSFESSENDHALRFKLVFSPDSHE